MSSNRGQECPTNEACQGAYIYQPPKHGKAGERPSKRRKVSSGGKLDEQSDIKHFVPLLNGEETPESAQLRYDTYKQLWSKQENKIQNILESVDAGVLADVLSFVRETSPQTYVPILYESANTI